MPAQEGGSSKAATLTKFYVFEATQGRRTWTYVGDVVARDREHAERLYYAEAGERSPEFACVSENSWRARGREVETVPKVRYKDLEMPAPPAGTPPLTGLSAAQAPPTAANAA